MGIRSSPCKAGINWDIPGHHLFTDPTQTYQGSYGTKILKGSMQLFIQIILLEVWNHFLKQRNRMGSLLFMSLWKNPSVYPLTFLLQFKLISFLLSPCIETKSTIRFSNSKSIPRKNPKQTRSITSGCFHMNFQMNI